MGKMFKLSSKSRKNINLILTYILLCILLIFFAFPFFSMLSISLMTDAEINFIPKLWSSSPSLASYTKVINAKTIIWFLNTVIIIVANLIGAPMSAALCSFGFSKLRFKGKDLCFAIVLGTLMLPGITMQVPLFVMFSKFGWIGTWYPLIVPAFFGGGAMNIFLMCQFMRGIPNQINEAAKIDGANKFRIFYNIIFPLCKPIITYVAVTVFLGVWNDFQGPLMYLASAERNYTIALGLYNTFNDSMYTGNFSNIKMAAGVLMMLPCLVIFIIFQRQLIDGIVLSGIKG